MRRALGPARRDQAGNAAAAASAAAMASSTEAAAARVATSTGEGIDALEGAAVGGGKIPLPDHEVQCFGSLDLLTLLTGEMRCDSRRIAPR